MTSFPNPCAGLVAHDTAEIAFRIAKRTGTKAYRCKTCQHWHTGNANRRINSKRPRGKRRPKALYKKVRT